MPPMGRCHGRTPISLNAERAVALTTVDGSPLGFPNHRSRTQGAANGLAALPAGDWRLVTVKGLKASPLARR